MDYANGKIYSIRSFQTDKYYIGSTTQSLSKRFSIHTAIHKKKDNYSTASEIMKYDDAYIELIEDYSCNNKNELNRREGELIRQYKNECVNHNIAGRTRQEYNIDNKEIIAEKTRLHNEQKKEILSEQHKQYREKNKETIIEREKQYYEQNKNIIAEKNKIYREKNKEILAQKSKERYQNKKNEKI